MLGLTLANRYRLDRLIGTGGMAAVYEASDLALGRVVAVKLFRLDPAEDAGAARQRDEVMVLAHLNHFALVTLYDAGTEVIGDIQRSFIVTEFVDGADLRSRIQEGPLDPGEVAGLGADLCEAVHYMHSQGVIHRDIKPANVLLATTDFPGRTARAKLADFGIARLFNAAHQTKEGTVIGTASYLSPEQAGGLPVGPASDVYSLGLVLLEGLTAERCYTGTAAETALARLRRQPDIPEWLGADWHELLTGMTARAAEHRLSPADAAVRLLALVPGAGGVHPVVPAPIDARATAVPEAALPDTVPSEVARPEGALADTALADTALADPALADTALADTAPPGPVVPTTVLQDAVLPETALHDTVLPETVLPEAALPESLPPKALPPKALRQDVTLAETVRAGAVFPETVLPDPAPPTVLARTVRPETPPPPPEMLLLTDVAPAADTPVRAPAPTRQPTRTRTPDEAETETETEEKARPRRWPLVLSGLLVALVTIVAVLFTVPAAEPPPQPPAYPAVDGPLGEHLKQLQESVEP